MTLTHFADLVHLNTDRIADTYHDFKDVEGFAEIASLDDIRANAGNLSIPLHVRGRAIGDEKGEYATNGSIEVVRTWEESFEQVRQTISNPWNSLSNRDVLK